MFIKRLLQPKNLPMLLPSQQKSLPTYIAANTELEGNLHVESDLLIDGIVHGNVVVQGDMEISTSGLVEGAEVRARNLVVHGVLKARVIVEGRLTLSRSARLEGDINAGMLSIESGAAYAGYIEAGDMKALPVSKMPAAELTSAESDAYGGELTGQGVL